jgi:hypothetical protein
MNKNLKHWLLQIFTTKIGWVGLSILGLIIFGILGNFYAWAGTAAIICSFVLFGFALLWVIFAWIVNPIKELINRRNK